MIRCAFPVLITLTVTLVVGTQGRADFIVPSDFDVKTYATITGPVRLSFDPRGVLYTGREITLSDRIGKIGVGGSPVTDYGPLIPDPDSVLFVPNGFMTTPITPPGSVFVGGLALNGSDGQITVIRPDESSFIPVGWGPSIGIGNITDMKFDRTGRLLVSTLDFAGRGGVLVSTGGNFTTLIPLGGFTPFSIAIDSANRIFTGVSSREVKIHDSAGNLINNSFVSGLITPQIYLAFGEGGAFGTDLYVSDGTNPSTGQARILRVDPNGNTTVFGTGGDQFGGFAFGPDSRLYVSDNTNNRILQIGVPEPSSFLLAGIAAGSAALAAWRRRRKNAAQKSLAESNQG